MKLSKLLFIFILFIFSNLSAQKKIKGIRTRYDEFEQNYFYHENVLWSNPFEIYIVKKEKQEPILRLSISFSGKNWVFPYIIYIKIDDKIYTLKRGIDFNYDDERQYVSKSAYTIEKIDIVVNDKIFKILKEISKNKHQKVKLKIKGKDNYSKMRIYSRQIVSIQKMIQAYYILGGKMH